MGIPNRSEPLFLYKQGLIQNADPGNVIAIEPHPGTVRERQTISRTLIQYYIGRYCSGGSRYYCGGVSPTLAGDARVRVFEECEPVHIVSHGGDDVGRC